LSLTLSLDPDLAAIVQPAWFVAEDVRVVERDSSLDEPMRAAALAVRDRPDDEEVAAAVRTMYKRVGLDPTKTRPSSEALRRRIRKGGELPRINTAVDIVNWCSLETQLPFGLYDADRIEGTDVALRLGRDGEEYGFHGSPSILIDGTDPFATEETKVGYACRIYMTEKGPAVAPTVEQITAALGA